MNHLFRGHVVLIALIFFGVFTAMTSAFTTSFVSSAKNARLASEEAQALHLAEAGIDHAIATLNENTNYAGESGVPLGAGTFSVSVVSSVSEKIITATGYIPNDTEPRAQKTVRASAGIDTSIVAFHYGVQVGAGGFSLSGGAIINGSVYANGNIDATSGVQITGSAVAATPPEVYVDQANELPTPISTCSSSTCITFGNDNDTEDFAQKFRLSSSVRANNIELYIKKVGAPSNVTVRIVPDTAGKPSSTTLLSGTLAESAVSTSFDWVSVELPSTPILASGKDYWLVIDASSSASKYYILGVNEDGYPLGSSAIGRYNSSWGSTTPATLDGYFRFSLGGGASLLGGGTSPASAYVGSEGGDAIADTVEGVTAYGTLYCTTAIETNKLCNTTYSAPPQPMPLVDAQIDAWKEDAESGGVLNGNQTVGSSGATIGPKKIVGNLTINGGGTLTVSGTLWVTGSISVTGGGRVVLSPTYGSQSGVIVADGVISLGGNGEFAGSGTTGSYPFLITTSACPNDVGCGNSPALSLSGGAGAVALVAQNGTATISGGGALRAISAQTISMGGGATLTYDTGLVNESFYSGSGGSWAFLPGTYTIVP